MIEWKTTVDRNTYQETLCLFVDDLRRSEVQYTFGPSDYDDINHIVEAATADATYFYRDIRRSQMAIAKFSLHKLLHKLKEHEEHHE